MATQSTISILIINGINQEVALPATVLDIIQINKVVQPEMVSVQRNGEFVLKEDFATTQVHEADEIDFLYFMGGGSQAWSHAQNSQQWI